MSLNSEAIARTRVEALVVAALSSVAIGGVAWLAWQLAPLLVEPVDLDALRPRFVELYRPYLNPEPVERFAYLCAVVSTVPAVLLSIGITRDLSGRYPPPPGLQHLLLAGMSLPLLGLVVGSEAFAYLMAGTSELSKSPRAVVILLLAIGGSFAGLVVVARSPRSRAGTLLSRQTGGLTSVVVIAMALTSLAPRVRSADMIIGDAHFEAVFYSVSQVMAGKTLLSDLPAQYGLYAELLTPVWWLTGDSVLAFTSTMVALQVAAAACLLKTVRALVRLDALFLICAATLMWLIGSLWASVLMSLERHEYYQIWPIRFFFPAIGTYLFFRSLQPRFSVWRAAGLGALSGIALVWNLDSGVPVTGAFLAFLLSQAAFNRRRAHYLSATGAFLGASSAVVAIFLGYLSFKAGGDLALAQWLKYQSIFYSVGIAMLPLPPWDAWVAVYCLYVIGLAVGVYRAATDTCTVRSNVLVFLSVLGIGLFTYFQGRSHPIVLCFVCWPSVIIAFALADELIGNGREARSRRALLLSAFPVVSIGLALSITWIVSLPRLAVETSAVVLESLSYAGSRTELVVKFIQGKTGGDRSAGILVPGQGAYFAEAGLASALPGPGLVETYLQEDFDRRLERLLARPVPHVFIPAARNGDVPESYRALLERYVVVDQFRRVLYLTPI